MADLCLPLKPGTRPHTSLQTFFFFFPILTPCIVVVARDGQEAYDMVKQSMSENKFFDLIFMDIQVSLSVLCHAISQAELV